MHPHLMWTAAVSLLLAGCATNRGQQGGAAERAEEPVPAMPVFQRSGAGAGPPGAYRWKSDCPAGMSGTNGILVTEVIENGQRMLSARRLPGEGRGRVAGTFGPTAQFYFDAPSSWDVHVSIDRAVGSTMYAGLRFHTPCAVEILADGTVLVDSEGISVTDATGRAWRSRSAQAGSARVVAFFTQ